jgi:hypothetical protein
VVGRFKPVTAGSASSWVSFWVDWPIDVSADELEATRHGHYWVRINGALRILRSEILHVKAGQFELDLPFTQIQWLVFERLKSALEYRVFNDKSYAPRGAFAVDLIL